VEASDRKDVPDSARAVPALTTATRSLAQPSAKRFGDLVKRAERGDVEAMRELRPLLEQLDHWEQVLDSPADVVRRLVLAAGLKRDLVRRAAWERRAARLQAELEGGFPSPLERTLCERVATCWLDVCLAEVAAAERVLGSASPKEREMTQRYLDRAHGRYLTSVQTLARVRRLLSPVLAQVNIAQPGAQQLNVASVGRPEAHLLIPGPGDDGSISTSDGQCLPSSHVSMAPASPSTGMLPPITPGGRT
jgi:hypothetical protein